MAGGIEDLFLFFFFLFSKPLATPKKNQKIYYVCVFLCVFLCFAFYHLSSVVKEYTIHNTIVEIFFKKNLEMIDGINHDFYFGLIIMFSSSFNSPSLQFSSLFEPNFSKFPTKKKNLRTVSASRRRRRGAGQTSSPSLRHNPTSQHSHHTNHNQGNNHPPQRLFQMILAAQFRYPYQPPGAPHTSANIFP